MISVFLKHIFCNIHTNLEQNPLNKCQQLLLPYQILTYTCIHNINITKEPNSAMLLYRWTETDQSHLTNATK